MTIILIIFCIWGASALIHSAREKRAKENAQRIASEQARIKREMREMKQQANEEVAARIALEREQMRQAKEQEKLAKEQEKQAAQLAKHELEIRNLKNRMKVCERDYKALKQRMENLNELYELASAELASADKAGDDKRKEKALRKIVTLDNQIASTEKRISKAKFDWNTAQKKLEVA